MVRDALAQAVMNLSSARVQTLETITGAMDEATGKMTGEGERMRQMVGESTP